MLQIMHTQNKKSAKFLKQNIFKIQIMPRNNREAKMKSGIIALKRALIRVRTTLEKATYSFMVPLFKFADNAIPVTNSTLC